MVPEETEDWIQRVETEEKGGIDMSVADEYIGSTLTANWSILPNTFKEPMKN